MKTVDILTALNYRADYSGGIGAGLFLWHTLSKVTKCARTYTLVT